MTEEALIQIVDEQDNPVGHATKEEAWQKGLRHRIIRVMLEDEQGRFLLQKRSSKVKLFPNLWDVSVGGHVDADESYIDAALRELYEELGLKDVVLKDLGAPFRTIKEVEGKTLHRFNKMYEARVESAVRLYTDPHEVAEVQWFTPHEIERLATEHPDEITDGIRLFVQKYAKV